MPGPEKDLIARFAEIVGPGHALTEPQDIAPYLTETRGLYHGATALVLKPGTTAEVAAIMTLASETKTPVVPASGRTGHVGGAVPREEGTDIVLSLERMTRIRKIDTAGNFMVVDGGVILAEAQRAAADNDRLFPLSLGSEGSARIGGNLATNAGGTAVLAYGNMRNLCLGLEVVLPTGEVWNGLRSLKKDNTGYDLRDLFIGAEGTLGVITGAVLKLFPRPKGHQVAFAGVASPEKALDLFNLAANRCASALTGFELMAHMAFAFTVKHTEGARDPLSATYPWYTLIDISTSDSQQSADDMITALLEEAFEQGLVEDAVIAKSEAEIAELWHMRETMSEAQKPEGGSIKHDVSVPVSSVPAFLREADTAVMAAVPGARICAFGHLGDGNIHYNISQPEGTDKAAFLARWGEVNAIVHAIVLAHGGSISAEHGIGRLKRDELARIREPIEIELMQRIKKAFDPAGIMNPDKVLKA
ncbi:FAD-binding oxidoreductase [Martelella mediterranea]|uniref:Putative FAD-linked oxidoreductase n=1 Tax=Martelella mediterranea DSM 17316 TaxID=1122214 RepID=A0A1U9YYC2_9HYPH|nr:FAD-binding oxidoreductase [Martelella mediterranea]AQZ50428.1 putative FAD-linked oxidoreductase [Martelella mediterranea DSM 17316]